MKILVVEDNSILRENLIFLLKKFQYTGEGAENGKIGLEKLSKNYYDAIILDINMPVMNGKEFLKSQLFSSKNIPVIALTSDSMLQDKLEMFDLGVEDYITKPFEIEELIARLKNTLKRGAKQIDETRVFGGFEINYSSKKIHNTITKQEIEFPYKQYLIVELLSKNIGYPQNKVKIMEYVWGEQEENLDLASTTLESHIYAIRKKLGKEIIKTIKSIGYVID